MPNVAKRVASQRAGAYAKRVYDRVEAGLLGECYTQSEAVMLLSISLDKVLEQAAQEERAETDKPDN